MFNDTLRALRALPLFVISSHCQIGNPSTLCNSAKIDRKLVMSRKPPTSTTGRAGISRTASSATLTNMPPPSKIPNRPPSAMSTSSNSSKVQNGNEPPSRPQSPQREAGKPKPRRTMVNGNVQSGGRGDKAGLLSDESGEMNIQVVVRCR
jgi:kinesin family protein 11